jgi:hypothetical protein
LNINFNYEFGLVKSIKRCGLNAKLVVFWSEIVKEKRCENGRFSNHFIVKFNLCKLQN